MDRGGPKYDYRRTQPQNRSPLRRSRSRGRQPRGRSPPAAESSTKRKTTWRDFGGSFKFDSPPRAPMARAMPETKDLVISDLPRAWLRDSNPEQYLMTLLNGEGSTLLSRVTSCLVDKEAGSASVTLRTFDDVRIVLALNGTEIPQALAGEANSRLRITGKVKESKDAPMPRRLYLGGIPGQATDGEIKALLAKHGALKIFTVAPRGDQRIAAFEYIRGEDEQQAVKTLDGFAFLGATLKVVDLAKGRPSEVGARAGPPDSKPAHTLMFLHVLPRDVDDFDDVMADFEIECTLLSDDTVTSIHAPRSGRSDRPPGLGSVFVRFATVSGASRCRRLMQGRTFTGKTVDVDFFSDVSFDKADFSSLLPNQDPPSEK